MRYTSYAGTAGGNPERIGILLVNSGTPGRRHRGGGARLPRPLPRRPARDRAAARRVAAGAVGRDPAVSAAPRRAQVPADLDRHRLAAARAVRAAAAGAHRRAGRSACSRRCRSRSACSTARRTCSQALERLRASGAQRILVLPLFPQYCAATGGAVFDQISGRAAPLARAPGAAFRGRLPRPSRLHRGAARERRGALGQPRAHRASAHVLPRHPGGLRAPRRPVPAPVPANRAPARRRAAAARGRVERELPVALWPARLAQAVYRHRAGGDAGPGRARGEPRVPGLCGGLPGDARGDRGREPRGVHACRRRALRVRAGAECLGGACPLPGRPHRRALPRLDTCGARMAVARGPA